MGSEWRDKETPRIANLKREIERLKDELKFHHAAAALVANERSEEIERLRKALGEVLREVAPYHPSWRIWDRVRSALAGSEMERSE